MSAVQRTDEPKGNVTVMKPEKKPRYVFDFTKLKRKEREAFGDDLQKAINFKEQGLTLSQADEITVKLMTKVITAWPAGHDFTDPTTFDDLSALEWKEATTAFMDQFRTAFDLKTEES